MGLWSAPRLASSEILQTFFELMGTGLVDSIDVSVTALANPLEGVWYSISSVLADFALGRAEIHGITNRDVLALLASDGLLHLGAHLFFTLALGLLLTFEWMRPGRAAPREHNWTLRTLFCTCGALVAVLLVLVPLIETPARFLDYLLKWLDSQGGGRGGGIPLAEGARQLAWYWRAVLAGALFLL